MSLTDFVRLVFIVTSHLSLLILVFIQVPGLVTLKKLPCVSFAGVDSLDDVKNHTYNELFVSGGFIVSDDSILNPEVVTVGKIYALFKAYNLFRACNFCICFFLLGS